MEKETPPRYLEGTGCLVLDHYGKVAYVMVSERSDITVAEEWADKLGFNEVRPPLLALTPSWIYHRNAVRIWWIPSCRLF